MEPLAVCKLSAYHTYILFQHHRLNCLDIFAEISCLYMCVPISGLYSAPLCLDFCSFLQVLKSDNINFQLYSFLSKKKISSSRTFTLPINFSSKSLISVKSLFFLTDLLRYNLPTIKFTHKYKIQRILVQNCASITTIQFYISTIRKRALMYI